MKASERRLSAKHSWERKEGRHQIATISSSEYICWHKTPNTQKCMKV